MNWLNRIARKNDDEFVALFSGILKIGSHRGFKIHRLGQIGNYPLILTTRPVAGKPKILLAAGFHGEEPAGCYGVLKFLQESLNLNSVSLSILPMVNPTGIRIGKRENKWGENVNRGFHLTKKTPLSKEGKLLIKHTKMLELLAQDGFVSLHEDDRKDNFFLYTFERGNKPGVFSYTLRKALDSVFKQREDGLEGEGGILDDGIVFNECDGTYEDYLFHKGIPYTACTETPGTKKFSDRVEANRRVIEHFIWFVNSGSKSG